MPAHVWTNEGREYVRAAWDSGMTTREIAIGLGKWCTKNMVIGLAHRMRLPPRQNPVQKGGRPKSEQPVKPEGKRVVHDWTASDIARLREMCAAGSAWADIASHIGVTVDSAQKKASHLRIARPRPVVTRRPRVPMAPRIKDLMPARSVSAWTNCQYILNDDPPYLWCDNAPEVRVSDMGKIVSSSYCREHYALCYQPYHGRGDLSAWLRGKV